MDRITDNVAKLLDDIWKVGGPIVFIHQGALPLWKKVRAGAIGQSFPEQFTTDLLYGKDTQPFFDRHPQIRDTLKKAAPVVATIAIAWLSYQFFRVARSLFTERPHVLNLYRRHLLPLRTLFNSMSACSELAAKLPELEPLKDEIDVETTKGSEDLRSLHSILCGPAFRQSDNAFAETALKYLCAGDIIQAVTILKRQRQKLFTGCALIGALDAYLSIATLLNEKRSDGHCFMPASFVDSSTPYLQIEDVWHPSLRGPIANTIAMGGSEPQSAIVTGLFESGKSTLLQAITLSIVMAQSIGFSSSSLTTLTPFASINAYASIKDDIANEQSLFKKELYRAVQLLEYIGQLPAGSFSFTTADATFTGTEASVGKAAAYAVARYLGTQPNNIALHATNFLSMSMLDTQNPACFSTSYLPTDFTDGKAAHSYRLQTGQEEATPSTAIFHEEEFPETMIHTMEHVLANPHEYPTAQLEMRQ